MACACGYSVASFSPILAEIPGVAVLAGISARRAAGYADTRSMLERSPWQHGTDPIEGVVEHH